MVEEMTSRERVIAALQGLACDRIPLASPVSVANAECMELTKAYFPFANTNAEKMANLSEASYKILKFDSVSPYFGTTNEAEALGCSVNWGNQYRMPRVLTGAFRSLKEFKAPRDFLDRKGPRTVIDAIAILKQRMNLKAAIFGKVIGPLSLIFYTCGIQNTLNSLILETDTVRQVLKEASQLCTDFALAQIEAGADSITISEDAVGDLISRECYRQVVMEAERNLNCALQIHVPTVFHLSCKIMDRADLFAQTGFDALSFDSRNDIQELRQLVGSMRLIGCINNPATLLNGSKKNITQEVFYSIHNGINLVSPECSIPLRVSNKNLLAMQEALTLYYRKIAKNVPVLL